MGFEIEAASALIASCALIILVTCSLQNLRAWGKHKGFGDLPIGALLGATSVAQMFHPIEPYSGFIFDLRNAPIALAGAFVSARAALLAACLAALARFGIGGTGMWTGMMAIFYACAAGLVWQTLRARDMLRARLSYFALGAMTATSLAIGVLLPEPVRSWFFLNAAPVLLAVYMTVLPVLAWIGDRGILLDSLQDQTMRAALKRKDFDLLSLPAFIHQMRLDSLLARGQDASAVLCLRIRSLYHLNGRHSRTRPEGMPEAVLIRIRETLPEFATAGALNEQTLLLPLTQDQLKQLDRIRDRIKEALHGAPFRLSRHQRHWVSYELGLLQPEAFQGGNQLVPRRIANNHRIDVQSAPVNAPRRVFTNGSGRFDRFENADMLFLKARLLMDEVA